MVEVGRREGLLRYMLLSLGDRWNGRLAWGSVAVATIVRALVGTAVSVCDSAGGTAAATLTEVITVVTGSTISSKDSRAWVPRCSVLC